MMREIFTLVTTEEVHDFVFNLWQTDIFRNSHCEKGGYINTWIKKLAEVPRIFYTMSADVERSHFTTWFNAIALRPEYTNSAISDLYYLHEIVHAVTMQYDPNMSWEEWHRKTTLDEMEASLESEVFAYIELPGLRELAFNHEIWVDRYLDAIPANYRDFLTSERKRVTHIPNPNDFIELQIANYAAQNIAWSEIWKENWRLVERHMVEFNAACVLSRKNAITIHAKFLQRMCSSEMSYIPFYEEAFIFYKVYKENGEKFGNKLVKDSEQDNTR